MLLQWDLLEALYSELGNVVKCRTADKSWIPVLALQWMNHSNTDISRSPHPRAENILVYGYKKRGPLRANPVSSSEMHITAVDFIHVLFMYIA